MRLRTIAVAASMSVVASAGIAAAQTTEPATTYTLKSSAASNKAGSKSRPAAFVPKFSFASDPASGSGRPAAPIAWSWSWNGVAANGGSFPKCTVSEIDAAQSDSVCPKGALVADGPLVAYLGPVGQPENNVNCTGETLRIYNGGKGNTVWFITGSGAQCAGLQYLAPFPVPIRPRRARRPSSWSSR